MEIRASKAALIAATFSTGMVYLDQTAINIALPAIQQGLGLDMSGLQWMLSAYLLFLSAPLLLCGILGDRYGRVRIYTIGILLFGLSGLGCGLASSLEQMILARAIQGLGAAMMVSVGLALLVGHSSVESRGKTIGVWVSITTVIIALGPTLGGMLVELVSWRLVFVLNLPLSFIGAWIALRHLPAEPVQSATRLDWFSVVLLLVGMGCVIFGLIDSGRNGFLSTHVLATLFAGAAFLLWFFLHQYQASNSLIPPTLFGYRNFRFINLVTLIQWIPINSAFLLLPLSLQQSQGYSPLEAGFAMLPISIAVVILSRLAGRAADRFGSRLPMLSGLLLLTLSLFLLSVAGAIDNYVSDLLPALLIYGLGLGLLIPPLTSMAMSSLPDAWSGIASGVNNLASRVANLLAIALAGSSMVSLFGSELALQLAKLSTSPDTTALILGQARSLAALDIPPGLDAVSLNEVQNAIRVAYQSGFSTIMQACALISLLCAALVFFYRKGQA